MRVVTIAARRALPSVRVLAQTLRQTNPSVPFVAVLIDLLPDEDRPDESFDVVDPSALALPEPDFARMTFMYDEGELMAALRPWVLDWALEQAGGGVVIQLAPETAVAAALDDVAEAARNHGVALCPRRLTAVPRDGLRPEDQDLDVHGWLDPGFLAVSDGARPWLSTWRARVVRDSGEPLAEGPAIDRDWLEASAALVDFARLADPTLNLSYWNVDERSLEESGAGPTFDGRPIRTIRFDGFDPALPWSLSSHVKDRPRVVLSEHPALVRLLADRAQQLAVAGHPGADVTSYRFDTFGDGVRVSRGVRTMYRRALLEARRTAPSAPVTEPPVPDHRGGFRAMRDWLAEPSSRMPRLTRLAYGIWASRVDLQGVFPLPQTDSRDAYAEWLTSYGLQEGYLGPDWVGVAQPLATEPPPMSHEPGCNVFGYFSSVLGVGTTGRALLTATREAGLPATVHTSTDTQSPKASPVEDTMSTTRYPINLVAINADLFPLWVEKWGPEFAEGAYTVGLWAWELDELPPRMQASTRQVDEIWALSEFNAATFRGLGDRPVHVFPVPATPVPSRPFPELAGLDIGAGYFLSAFDYLSEVERKNPLGLISAYGRAFPNHDGPALVIKSINGWHRRTERERVRRAAADVPGVLLVEEYLPTEVMDALLQHALAFVSLHRSEGLGMGLLEAMAQGTPAIATAYSGNMDFMTEENSLLVPFTLELVSSDAGYYAGLGHWAEPDLAVAAAHLRSLANDQALATALGARAQQDVLRERTPKRAADFVRERVESIIRARDAAAAAEAAAAAAAESRTFGERLSTRVRGRRS